MRRVSQQHDFSIKSGFQHTVSTSLTRRWSWQGPPPAKNLYTRRPTCPATNTLNPGAGWGAKQWPAERFGEVAKSLAAMGYCVVVNTGPSEESLAKEVVRTSGRAAMTAECNVSQLISLTRRATVMIAGDTGPLHLACALGKPVVGIFGPTDPARNGPYGVDFRVLRNPSSKRDHSRKSQPEAGLLTITPDDVLGAALDLLNSRRSA